MEEDTKAYIKNHTVVLKDLLENGFLERMSPVFLVLLQSKSNLAIWEKMLSEIRKNKLNFQKVISKISSTNKYDDFASIKSEVIVLAYFASKFSNPEDVVYEPKIHDKTNIGDVRVKIDGNECYLEVYTALQENFYWNNNLEICQKVEKTIIGELGERFPYWIVLTDDFDLEMHLSFLIEQLGILQKSDSDQYIIYEDKTLARVNANKFLHVDKGDGDYSKLEFGGKLKHAILDKLDKNQFPDEAYLKILVVNISSALFNDVFEDAVLGKLINITEYPNGQIVFNRKHEWALFSDTRVNNIDLIICFSNDDFDLKKGYYHYSLSTDKKEIISANF